MNIASLKKSLAPRRWRREYIFLCLIIATGIFLRTYHFSDWLLFEIDQTYDTRIVSQAIENGPQDLPLLGPTAGGGRALRLGPAFYYMEYASALIFGDTPTGHAMLVLLFSILTMPLFYLFCRRYFHSSVSLALLALLSGSVFMILYGRFSWSPNVLPFLILLSFYALLRSVSETETKRDRYFLIATASLAVTSQIHFNAFFTIPTIAILFLLYKRPRFDWKTWIAACGIVALIYSPMVLNDIVTHGENVDFFLKKISKGGSSHLLDSFTWKSVTDLQYNASGYFFIASGIDHINGGRLQEYGFKDPSEIPWRAAAIVLFAAELALLARAIWKERVPARRDFLVLVLLWVALPFIYFYSLLSGNFHFYPRFYLLIAPAAIILFGLILEQLAPGKNRTRQNALVGITLLLLIPNLTRMHDHFNNFAHPEKTTSVEREDIFPNDTRLTLGEQLAITDYLLAIQRKNGYPIYISTFHEYEPVFWYHLKKQGIPYSDILDSNNLYAQGNYFLIRYPGNGTRSANDAFTITDQKTFGTLVVYTLTPNPEKIRGIRQSSDDRKELEQTTQIRELKTWKDIF